MDRFCSRTSYQSQGRLKEAASRYSAIRSTQEHQHDIRRSGRQTEGGLGCQIPRLEKKWANQRMLRMDGAHLRTCTCHPSATPNISADHLQAQTAAVSCLSDEVSELHLRMPQDCITWMVKGVSFFLLMVLSSMVSGMDKLIILL